jgi:hypothetical protein
MEYTITGRTIKAVRNLTKTELKKEGFDSHEEVTAIVLDDGGVIYASIDEEGNGPGVLFGRANGKGFYVTKE